MTDRVFACRTGDVPPGTVVRVVPVEGEPVAVYNVDGELYATDDRCTHSVASLSDGELDGDCIVCPVHGGMFHVPTGRALSFPVTVDVATRPIEVDGDEVYVVIPQPAPVAPKGRPA